MRLLHYGPNSIIFIVRNIKNQRGNYNEAINGIRYSLLREGSFNFYSCNMEDTTVNQLPELKKRCYPEYPVKALRLNVNGTFKATAYLNKSGDFVICEVTGEPKGYGFEDATAAAFLKWKWTPAIICEKTSPVWIGYTFEYVAN